MCCKTETPTLKAGITVRKFLKSNGVEVWHKSRGRLNGGGTQRDAWVMLADAVDGEIDTVGGPVEGHDDSIGIRRREDGSAAQRTRREDGIAFTPVYPGSLIGQGRLRPFVNLGLLWVAGRAVIDGETVDAIQAYDATTLRAEFLLPLTDVGAATFIDIQPSPFGCIVHRQLGSGSFGASGIVERVDADGTIGAVKEYAWAARYDDELDDYWYHEGTWGADEYGVVHGVCISSDGKAYFFSTTRTPIPTVNPPLNAPLRLRVSSTDEELEVASDTPLDPITIGAETFTFHAQYQYFDHQGPWVSDTTLGGSGSTDVTCPVSQLIIRPSHTRTIRALVHFKASNAFFDGEFAAVLFSLNVPLGANEYGLWVEYGTDGSVSQWPAWAVYQLGSTPIYDDANGESLFIDANGHFSASYLVWLQKASDANPLGDWYTALTYTTGGPFAFWFPLQTVTAWATDDDAHYVIGRPNYAQNEYPPSHPSAEKLHVELVAVDKADGTLLWTARHSSDDAYEALLDVIEDGDYVYVVGVESTYAQ